MALELVYEGLLSGLKNIAQADFADASVSIVPGRICCLSSVAGEVVFTGLLAGTSTDLTPFGLVADYKEDGIASGKVSVYLNGQYMSDQITGSISRGDMLSFDDDGILKAASKGEWIVGICTEEEDDAGFIELVLNIAGIVKA